MTAIYRLGTPMKKCNFCFDETTALSASFLVTTERTCLANPCALLTQLFGGVSSCCYVFHSVGKTTNCFVIKRYFCNPRHSPHEFISFAIVFNPYFLTPPWRGSVSRNGHALFAPPKTVIRLKNKCFKALFPLVNWTKTWGGEAIPQTVISAITWVNTIWPLTPIVRCV